MFVAIIHGVVLALGLILPLGAQNVFVFNQGASQASFKGIIPVVLTAALCDTFLILLAILGVSIVVLTIPELQITLYMIGFVFLVYMGWTIWRSKPTPIDQQAEALSSKKQILLAMSVSLLNPHAILDTIGVIGTSSLSYTGMDKLAFTVATILVSWLWFLGLGLLGKKVRKVDTTGRILTIINKISALMIWAVALYIVLLLYRLT